MNRFLRRFNIGLRLALSFVILILLIIFATSVGLWQVNVIRLQAEQLHQVAQKEMAVLRVHNNLLFLIAELEKVAATQDVSRLTEEGHLLRDNFLAEVDQAVTLLSDSPLQTPQNQAIVRELQSIRSSSLNQIETIIGLAMQEDWPLIHLLLEEQTQQADQTMRDLTQKLDVQMAQERALAQENMQRAHRGAKALLIITGLLISLVSVALGVSVIRSISHPLAQLNRAARALARGEFHRRIKVYAEDELAHLSRVFNTTSAQLADLYLGMEGMVQQRTKELQYRALQLETSIAMGQRITSMLDLDTLLGQAVELIKNQYGYIYVGIFLFNKDHTRLTIRTSTTTPEVSNKKSPSPTIDTSTVIDWVVENQQPHCINDISQATPFGQIQVSAQAQSKLVLPLGMGDDLLGVLDIESDQVNTFTEEDMLVLQSLADQVATAIHNASLYQGEKSRRRLVETLYRVSQALTYTLDLKEVLDLILEQLAQIVPYDRAAVLLEKENELEMLAARGFPAHMDPLQIRVSINENDVFEKIYRTRRPLVIPDVQERSDWQNVGSLPRARAWLGIPLIRFDQVVGMLSVTRETPDAYRDEDVTLVTAFSGQAAIALENARLYDEITRFSHALEEKVKERTRELQVAYDQLERIDKTKSNFITITAHELRTPLTVLHGYSQMLLRDGIIQKNNRHQELISSIYSGTVRLHEIVNNLLDMTKIDSRSLELYHEPLSVSPLLQSVCRKFSAELDERGMVLIVEPLHRLPTIEADKDALRKVFYHLIVNAIKYTPDGGTITIRGHSRKNQRNDAVPSIELIISDTGIGIDTDYQELIFTKFYQTGKVTLHSSGKTKFKGGGPGLGLAIAQGIVEAHQGKLWVESPGCDEEACPGSDFHLVLPLRQNSQAGGHDAPAYEAVSDVPT